MTNVTQRHRAQQRIRQCMQKHIAVRMGFQPMAMRDLNAPQNDRIALTKGMDIKALANTHADLRSKTGMYVEGKPYCRLRTNSASARSDGTVIFRLSARPSTKTGILPENSIRSEERRVGKECRCRLWT